MFDKIKMYEVVRNINSPYDNIAKLMKEDEEVRKLSYQNEDEEIYDLSKMIPKVTYDDWIVCLYEIDNKLYCITDVDIAEVEPVAILMYNKNLEIIKENGEKMSEKEIMEYYNDYTCAGEADDMTCYIFFE